MATPPTKPKGQRRVGIDPLKAAEILVDAVALGDKAAAVKWDIHPRTIARYRVKAVSDTSLSRAVTEKVAAESGQWASVRLRFLRRAIDKLDQLVATAKLENMRDVVGAVKIVGELHLVVGALGEPDEDGKQPSPHLAGQGAPQDGGSGAAGGVAADGSGGVH